MGIRPITDYDLLPPKQSSLIIVGIWPNPPSHESHARYTPAKFQITSVLSV